MKTTIDLPDALAMRAKQVARDQGTTLREIIEAALRAELERRNQTPDAVPFTFRTVGGSGLKAGVVPADLRDHAYDATP